MILPSFPVIDGSLPGRLDSSQHVRLLRDVTNHLVFATYDDSTACGLHDLSSAGMEKRASKPPEPRIVIETNAATWKCTWRFVPPANVDPELNGDEGIWPRLVDFCGQFIYISQDQWDLHKLDNDYECYVPAPPNLTIIRCKVPITPQPEMHPSDARPQVPTPNPSTHSIPSGCRADQDASSQHSPFTPGMRWAPRPCPSVVMGDNIDDSDDDTDVSMVDKNYSSMPCPGYTKGVKHTVFMRQSCASSSDEGLHSSPGSPPANHKRLRCNSPTRKTQTPTRKTQNIHRKKFERVQKKMAKLRERFSARKKRKDRAFLEECGIPAHAHDVYLYQTTSQAAATQSEASSTSAGQARECSEVEDETARQSRIEASRRKLAELNKDKLLWEASKRQREAQEVKQKEASLRGRKKKQSQEAEQKFKAPETESDGEWRRHQKAQEQEIRRRQKSKEMFIFTPHSIGDWSVERAYKRYLRAAEVFDKATFEDVLVTFATIPWPILFPSFSIEDIVWTNVDNFFLTYSRLMDAAQFKKLVISSQRRFHPDKWCARKILPNVKDESERELLEVAGNLVAQAINQILELVKS